MKINWKIRLKDLKFWSFLFAAIVSSCKINPEDFSSWKILLTEILAILNNPYLLILTIWNIIGVISDPTTKGISDSKQALNYR